MKIDKELSDKELDVWLCECGTWIPIKKGSPKPECEYCRRVKEKFEKEGKKFLFVCSGGIQRSPTFAKWFNEHTRFEAKSLGIWNNPDHKLFDWADKIFVMDLSHEYWFHKFRPQLLSKVEVIGISDQYDPDDTDLIGLIQYWVFKRFTN